MYETARKYSEQVYCTKEEMMKEMDSYLIEPIWQEIKQYRSFFRRDFHFHEKPYYIIQNNLVVKQTLQLERMVANYETTTSLSNDQIYCSYLSDEDNEQFQQYIQYLIIHHQLQAEEFFQSFFRQFQIKDLYMEHLHFLLNEEEPFLLRLYSLLFIDSKRSMALLYLPFLVLHKETKMLALFDFLSFAKETNFQEEQDITYGYLEMLKRLRLILYKKMVLLNTNNEISNLQLQEKELIERYPALKKEQIQFYVQHRSLGHYYTIQNYIKACKVCYETARYSLDQLVEYHWYDKKKIGKKFVYHVV